MADVAVALAVHVIAVVWWLGGVAFVTTVELPRLREEGMPHASFRRIERRFAPQARAAALAAGASGLYLVWRIHAWAWFAQARYWWLDAMSAYWLLFFAILFLAEPLRRPGRGGEEDAARWLRRTLLVHRTLLALGLAAAGAAAAGAHGWI